MKSAEFAGDSLAAIRGFPDVARRESGYQIDRLQSGLDPTDWRPLGSIGPGVREIRIRTSGQFRVIYVANMRDRVVILHAFHKKTRKTSIVDIRKARRAFKQVRSRDSR